MKANELMIGDWIQLDGSYYRIRELKKKGVIKLYDITQYGEHEVELTTDWIEEFIQGIPLTEEILNKNFPEYEPGYDIGWWPTEDGKYHIEFSRDKMEVDMECGIDYVHELQHLLKLIKLDKEIEL
jgi:hypothetical protein